MELSEAKKKEYMKRLLLSRMRLLNTHGFYGLLLMHMVYAIDETAETCYNENKSNFPKERSLWPNAENTRNAAFSRD